MQEMEVSKMDLVVKLIELFHPPEVFAVINISFFLQLKYNRKFAESVSVSVLTIIMILYTCTLFMPLTHSGYIVLGTAVAAFAYNIFYLCKNHHQIKITDLFSCSFLLFFLYYIFACFAFRQYYPYEWDEFSHWMLLIKNMIYFDNFGITGASTVMFSGYPPAAGLFESFFNLFSASFHEGSSYLGFNILVISLLISLLKEYHREDNLKILMAFLIVLAVPLIFYKNVYGFVYVDSLLGIMFARLIYMIISTEKYDLFFIYNFSISSAVLVLTKASGKGLYVFALLVLLIDFIFFGRKQTINGINIQNKLVRSVAWMSILIVPLAADRSWNLYLKLYGLKEAWNSSTITIQNLLQLFSRQIPWYRRAVRRSFIDAFFNLTPFGDLDLKCSYFLLLVVFMLIMFMIARQGENKKRVYCLGIVLSASYILYTISLLILYFFSFGEYEASQLASFGRYMNTIALGNMLIAAILLLNPAAIHRNLLRTAKSKEAACHLNRHVIIMVLILFMTSVELKNLFIWQALKSEHQDLTIHMKAINEILDATTDKVYCIAQGTGGYDYLIMQYALTPVHTDGYSIANEPISMYARKFSAKQWSDELIKGNYTYVYLYIIDDQFCLDFGELFADPNNISEYTLYRVESSGADGMVTLIPYEF